MNNCPIIDFHAHILPEMDDGSRSVSMSIKMLGKMTERGVGVVAATPHYHFRKESPDSFLARRQKSFEQLSQQPDFRSLPIEIRLGAEVALSHGIPFSAYRKLTLTGTDLLLLEMPFSPWGEYEFSSLEDVCLDSGCQVVIAHLERYLPIQQEETIDRLLELPVLIQVNSSSLVGFFPSKAVLSLFREDRVHFLGSDCHNLTNRSPDLEKGRAVLEKRFGQDYLLRFDSRACSFLLRD